MYAILSTSDTILSICLRAFSLLFCQRAVECGLLAAPEKYFSASESLTYNIGLINSLWIAEAFGILPSESASSIQRVRSVEVDLLFPQSQRSSH